MEQEAGSDRGAGTPAMQQTSSKGSGLPGLTALEGRKEKEEKNDSGVLVGGDWLH